MWLYVVRCEEIRAGRLTSTPHCLAAAKAASRLSQSRCCMYGPPGLQEASRGRPEPGSPDRSQAATPAEATRQGRDSGLRLLQALAHTKAGRLSLGRAAAPFAPAAPPGLVGQRHIAAEVEAEQRRAAVRRERVRQRGGGALERGGREALAAVSRYGARTF